MAVIRNFYPNDNFGFKKEDAIELATYIITETFYEQLMLDDYLRKQISTYYSLLLDEIL